MRRLWSQYNIHPFGRSQYAVGLDFQRVNGTRSFWLFTIARWACIPFSLLGGYFCFRWAGELFGATAGLLALVLWCFSPYVLGHASVITPDAHAAAMGVAASYTFWLWLRQPGCRQTFVAGVVLGLAELAKFTFLAFYPVWVAVWVVYRLPEFRSMGLRCYVREAGMLLLMFMLSVWVINLGYGFEGSCERLENYRFQSRTLSGARPAESVVHGGNRFAGAWVGSWPVPVPRNYVQGIDAQKADFESERWSYLRGQWRKGGWWYYYLYALAIKVPLGTWALALLALLVSLFRAGYSTSWRDEIVLLLPLVAILILVSSQTGFNHHSRYVLPILPFAFVWVSKVARAVQFGHRKITALAAGALLWSVGSSLWVYPHSVSYFNELVGGPKNGHAHLGGSILDSNIDWGQDLLYLKRWLDEHPEARPLGLAFNGGYDPTIAAIEYTTPPVGPDAELHGFSVPDDQIGPLPGWYAVSVNKIRSRTKEYVYFLASSPEFVGEFWLREVSELVI